MKLLKGIILILIFGIISITSVFSIDMRIGGQFWNPTVAVVFRINRFDFRAGYDFTGWGTDYIDYLYLSTDFRIIDKLHLAGPLHFHVGVGGYLLLPVEDNGNENIFGIRAPVGLQLLFADEFIEIFVDIAPAIEIAPSVEFFKLWSGFVGITFKLPTK